MPGRVTANTAGLGLGYNGGRGVPPFSALPAFCRVAATLKPTPSSDIHMELWLPLTGWNGHFRGASPNGLGGIINYNAMGVGLTDGFAVASTDTGHQGGDTAWMQTPDKVTDFAGRAMHETTIAGKAITSAYYSTAPKYSYMIECGGGSAAALHEVQKYPSDYDGIVVGGHAAHLTRQIFGQLWLWQATHPNGVAILPAPKLSVIHQAVLRKCDVLDGVRDGLLENPTRCTFDPKEIECRSGDGPNCLTAAQVSAAQKIYTGPVNPRTNERIWPPLYRGSELDWNFFSEADSPIGIATSALRLIKSDPAWDFRTSPVDFDRDVALADRSDISRVNASNVDISEYVRRGGKLILSGGWNNALVPAGAVLDYYNRVRSTIGVEEHATGGSSVHGPRHDRMQWRSWHGHLRHAQCHAALGRRRPGSKRGARVARRERESCADAAAVSLSADGGIPGQWQYGRREEFRLPRAIGDRSAPGCHESFANDSSGQHLLTRMGYRV